jgi:hypothetical protein
MAEVELRAAGDVVIDAEAVENYVRDSKIALVNAVGYLAVLAGYAVVRVVLDVPYLRAAIASGIVVAAGAVAAKCRLVPTMGGRLAWFCASAAAGFAAGMLVLVALVEVNRGTLFAAATAALAAAGLTHLVDRAALSRA